MRWLSLHQTEYGNSEPGKSKTLSQASEWKVYPGTNVLRNVRDIRDPGKLSELEARATNFRIRQLQHKPVVGAFDTRHLQSIHRHIFQDVYPWAGELRTVHIGKLGDLFAFKEHIVSTLAKTVGRSVNS